MNRETKIQRIRELLDRVEEELQMLADRFDELKTRQQVLQEALQHLDAELSDEEDT